MKNAYRKLFDTPTEAFLVTSGIFARLPNAMTGIGIIVMLAEQRDEYWQAGLISGAFILSNALFSPLISKLADRFGQSRVLQIFTTLNILMLIILISAAHYNASFPQLLSIAVLSGLAPNITAMIRVRWIYIITDNNKLHTALSLDAVLTELTFIIGPPLAIGASISFFPAAGLVVSILLLILGTTGLILQKSTEPSPFKKSSSADDENTLSPALWIIISILMAMGVTGGTIDIAVLAFSKQQGWPTAAIYILAAYALGSMITGLFFGSVKIYMRLDNQFFIAVVLTGVTASLPLLSFNIYTMAVMVFIAGMSFAPTMVIMMSLGAVIIPKKNITEGFTWMSTGVSVGVASGAGVSGVIVDRFSPLVGFYVSSVAGLLMIFIAYKGKMVITNIIKTELTKRSSLS